MKNVVLIAFIFFITFSMAQPFSPVLQEVIDAENGFAALSKKQNTRDAFVANLSDEGIVFEKTNPVLGRETWMKRKADNSLLFWWPVFSDVSVAGDFGYNTGPFEWSPDRLGTKPVAYGYFSSVWKKEKDGKWKVAIDMGMEIPSAEEKAPALSASKKKPAKSKNGDFTNAKEEIIEGDKKYVEQLNLQSVSLLKTQLSSEVRVHRTGHFPLITPLQIDSFSDSRENYQFEYLGGDMASSGDMAYTYGRVKALTKTDKKEVTLNYLRIWKKEDGKNWKIVLDVIGG